MGDISEADIRIIVSAVLAEQGEHQRQIVRDAVTAMLVSFGLDEDDNREMKADFAQLRSWRKSTEMVKSMTMKTAILVIISGFLGMVWMGLKALLTIKP